MTNRETMKRLVSEHYKSAVTAAARMSELQKRILQEVDADSQMELWRESDRLWVETIAADKVIHEKLERLYQVTSSSEFTQAEVTEMMWMLESVTDLAKCIQVQAEQIVVAKEEAARQKSR